MKMIFTIHSEKPNERAKNKAMMAKGLVRFMNDDGGAEIWQYPALSGGYGNGPLPDGEYTIKHLSGPKQISKIEKPGPYTLFDFGWFGLLEPHFDTTRTSLGVHPDGNTEGSLGCLVFPFKSLNDNVKVYNLLRDQIERAGRIEVVVQKASEEEEEEQKKDEGFLGFFLGR